MTSSWVRRTLVAAGVTTILLAGSAGASSSGPEDDTTSSSSSPEAPKTGEQPTAQPAELVESPIIVVRTNDPDFGNEVSAKGFVLGTAVKVEPLPTDGPVLDPDQAVVVMSDGAEVPLAPDEILAAFQALVALRNQGFVWKPAPYGSNPTITVELPQMDGAAPLLKVTRLSVEAPPPVGVTPSAGVDGPTGRSDGSDGTGGLDGGDDSGSTGVDDSTGVDGATGQSDGRNGTGESGGGDGAGESDGNDGTGAANGFAGRGLYGNPPEESEILELEPENGSDSTFSTVGLRDRLKETSASPKQQLPVTIDFELAPGDVAQSEDAVALPFSMASSSTAEELVGDLTMPPSAGLNGSGQVQADGLGITAGLNPLLIMVGALVLMAGIAAGAVWFVAARQKKDDEVLAGVPLGQPVPGGPPPPSAPRAPADATEGAALPMAAGTSTLTALAFRDRVNARSQLFSLTRVPSVNGTNQSVPGGSEALEKWWGGPIGAEGVMMGGWSEKIPGKGEDAVPLALATPGMGSTLIAVADGLGGAGARTVSTETGEATAARVASSLALNELAAWWADTDDVGHIDYLDLKRSIAGILRHQLRDQADAGLVGTLVREYPTTLAAATVNRAQGKAKVKVIWAGDSRVYLFSSEGFQLLTTDQVSGDADELAQMYADPQMTNMISADRPFNLQVAETVVAGPFLLLAATDGCFGYLPSPAHLEPVLLEDLVTSGSEDEWARKLTHRFNGVAGDDTSFAAMLFGSTFDKFRKGMRPRAERAHRDQIGPVQAAADGDERRRAIDAGWRSYRNGFVARRAQMPVSTVEGE